MLEMATGHAALGQLFEQGKHVLAQPPAVLEDALHEAVPPRDRMGRADVNHELCLLPQSGRKSRLDRSLSRNGVLEYTYDGSI